MFRDARRQICVFVSVVVWSVRAVVLCIQFILFLLSMGPFAPQMAQMHNGDYFHIFFCSFCLWLLLVFFFSIQFYKSERIKLPFPNSLLLLLLAIRFWIVFFLIRFIHVPFQICFLCCELFLFFTFSLFTEVSGAVWTNMRCFILFGLLLLLIALLLQLFLYSNT